MEAGGSLVVIGGNLTFTIELGDTELVNQLVEEMVNWTKVSLLAATLAFNIAAAVVIQGKEDTPINRLIIWDCLMNVLTAIVTIGERRKLSNEYLCSIFVFTNVTLSAWNRLVPVGIAVFRYVLVYITVQCCVHK
jgi:hypothetical protein